MYQFDCFLVEECQDGDKETMVPYLAYLFLFRFVVPGSNQQQAREREKEAIIGVVAFFLTHQTRMRKGHVNGFWLT